MTLTLHSCEYNTTLPHLTYTEACILHRLRFAQGATHRFDGIASVAVHISHLRHKLDPYERIVSVYGLGYRLEAVAPRETTPAPRRARPGALP